jgi:parallel beta-helix repeat protein
MSVNGPGTITFWWKKTDYLDKTYTYLYVEVDNKSIYYKNNSYDWEFKSIPIPSGQQKVTWVFRIKESLGGTVCWPLDKAQGWIDEVMFIPQKETKVIEPQIAPKVSECPNDIIVINGPNSTCDGAINSASVSYTGGDAYYWKITNGTILSGNNSNKIIWTSRNSGHVVLDLTIIQKFDSISCSRISDSKSIRILPIGQDVKTFEPREGLNLSNEINKCNCTTIYLENGTYYGPLNITANNIRIKSRFKHGASINSGSNARAVFLKSCSNVHVEDLNISSENIGIRLFNCNLCNLNGNMVYFGDKSGIYIDYSNNSSLDDNELFYKGYVNNDVDGYYLKGSNNNSIKAKKISSSIINVDYKNIFYINNSYYNKIVCQVDRLGRIDNNGLICVRNESAQPPTTVCMNLADISSRGNTWIFE